MLFFRVFLRPAESGLPRVSAINYLRTYMKLEMQFCKKGILRYISHLDLVRLFQRAVRRADLPVKLSEGFSPRYKIGFGQALKLGVESESERIIFTLRDWVNPEEFAKRMNGKLPEEIKVRVRVDSGQ